MRNILTAISNHLSPSQKKTNFLYAYLIKMSKQYPKYYKLILNSANGRYINGEWAFNIDVPLFDNLHEHYKWVMSVQSFHSSVITSTGGNIGNTHTNASSYGNIHIREFTQITSYSSRSKTNTDIVATFTGKNFASSPALNTVAVPIDSNFWIQRQITVYFSDATQTRLTTPQDAQWQLTLCLYKADD